MRKKVWRRIFSVILSIFLIQGDISLYSQLSDYKAQFRAAKQEFKEGKFVGAAKRLERLLKYIPEEKREIKDKSLLLLGACYEKTGEEAKAKDVYKIAKKYIKTPYIEGIELSSLPLLNRTFRSGVKLKQGKRKNVSLSLIAGLTALVALIIGYVVFKKRKSPQPSEQGDRTENNLIAYWSFDGDAKDKSGHNMNGEVHGATLCKDKFGRSNRAYCFNGHSYIAVPSGTIDDLTEGTVSLWFRIDELNRRHALIDKTRTGSVNAFQIMITENNKLHVSIGAYYGEKWGYYSNAIFRKGKWYHIAITWDRSYWKIYVDGELDKSIQDSRTVPHENIKVFMGKADYNASDLFAPDYLIGAMDEVKVFNKALSASEIKELYEEYE